VVWSNLDKAVCAGLSPDYPILDKRCVEFPNRSLSGRQKGVLDCE